MLRKKARFKTFRKLDSQRILSMLMKYVLSSFGGFDVFLFWGCVCIAQECLS